MRDARMWDAAGRMHAASAIQKHASRSGVYDAIATCNWYVQGKGKETLNLLFAVRS